MYPELVEIRNEDKLLRRVRFTNPSYVKEDLTLTSFAFKLRKGEAGLSVDIEKLTNFQNSISDVTKYRLFVFTAFDIRSCGADCFHKPVEENYAHAEITAQKITNSISSQLAKLAQFVNYP